MSGAQEAHAALLTAALRGRPALLAPLNAMREADAGLRTSRDLTDALHRCAELVLAADALADTVAALARDARDALAATMWDTGATGIRLAHHTVGVTQPRPSVVITGDVPAAYMRQPPPAPDKAAIGRALAAGQTVPGAALSNGGAPILTIRPLKEIAR